MTGAQSGALAAYNATRTIPIVVITPENPIVSGFAQSIAKPSGNITGTWSAGDDALVGKRLDLLKLAVPGVARVGAILNPHDPNDAAVAPRLPAAAKALGMTIQMFEVRDVTKLDDLSAQITRAGVHALFVSQSPAYFSARAQITAMVARLGLPAVYGWREFAEAGGLMSYGPNLPDMYRQSARLVDRILKGASPADLPIELPSRYELIVNLKAAKARGLRSRSRSCCSPTRSSNDETARPFMVLGGAARMAARRTLTAAAQPGDRVHAWQNGRCDAGRNLPDSIGV